MPPRLKIHALNALALEGR